MAGYYRRRKSRNWVFLWIPIVLFVLPIFEVNFPKEMSQFGLILYIVSFCFGFYFTYPLVMWVDRRLSYTDFGIWLRMILSGVFMIVGIFIFLPALLIQSVALINLEKFNFFVSETSLNTMIIGFSVGLVLFSSYLFFTYMRKAGWIVFVR